MGKSVSDQMSLIVHNALHDSDTFTKFALFACHSQPDGNSLWIGRWKPVFAVFLMAIKALITILRIGFETMGADQIFGLKTRHRRE